MSDLKLFKIQSLLISRYINELKYFNSSFKIFQDFIILLFVLVINKEIFLNLTYSSIMRYFLSWLLRQTGASYFDKKLLWKQMCKILPSLVFYPIFYHSHYHLFIGFFYLISSLLRSCHDDYYCRPVLTFWK